MHYIFELSRLWATSYLPLISQSRAEWGRSPEGSGSWNRQGSWGRESSWFSFVSPRLTSLKGRFGRCWGRERVDNWIALASQRGLTERKRRRGGRQGLSPVVPCSKRPCLWCMQAVISGLLSCRIMKAPGDTVYKQEAMRHRYPRHAFWRYLGLLKGFDGLTSGKQVQSQLGHD